MMILSDSHKKRLQFTVQMHVFILFQMNTETVIINVGSRPEGYTEMMILSVFFNEKMFFFDVVPFFYKFSQRKLKWFSN